VDAHRWARPEWHHSIDSTNLAVLADPRPGRVVVADHQSAGQGRRGRSWSAPPGACLAVSVAVRAPEAPLLGWVPLAAGLAVVGALTGSRYAVDAALKWPNDVLVPDGADRRKVCGILAQVVPAAGGGAGVVVVGTGLNVDQERADLPVDTATSWRLARGGAVLPEDARATWLEDYLRRLARLLEDLATGPEAVRTAYRRQCLTLGQRVRVHLPDGSVEEGTARDVDPSGALVVEGPAGMRHHHAGDVVHLRHG
jgi:BirA family transcriptional regulator, biotin operon repressor / biotin---[acetyl-CoA-carboxylase] ligase